MTSQEVSLFLSAHLDDAECAASGTIQRLMDSGNEVLMASLSTNGRLREAEGSLSILGLNLWRAIDFPVRRFKERRQSILDFLIELRESKRIDSVYCPASFDTHQDHQTLFQETIRAFRWGYSIYGYDFPWNGQGNLTRFVEITENQLSKKIEALSCYDSQKQRTNRALDPEYVRALAVERGNHIGVPYAEAFEVIKQAWKQSS